MYKFFHIIYKKLQIIGNQAPGDFSPIHIDEIVVVLNFSGTLRSLEGIKSCRKSSSKIQLK